MWGVLMNIGFISLGCSKNLVVTEEMIGLFKKHNYIITSNVEEADIILINTKLNILFIIPQPLLI